MRPGGVAGCGGGEAWRGPGTKRAGASRAELALILSQAQAADDREVARPVLGAQVVQEARALADHHQEAAPAGMVLLVGAQVLGQPGDALGEQGDLYFRRAGVVGLAPVRIDDFRFAVL